MSDLITIDRKFVRDLVGIGVAIAQIAEVEPQLLELIDMAAPSDEELDTIMEQAMEEFA